MAAAQASKVIPMFEDYEEEVNSSPPVSPPKEGTAGLAIEQNLKKTDIDLFLCLLGVMKKMPKQLFETISTIFGDFRESETDFSADEILPIEIENLPIVNTYQHQENISYLDNLRAILPETENDIEITVL